MPLLYLLILVTGFWLIPCLRHLMGLDQQIFSQRRQPPFNIGALSALAAMLLGPLGGGPSHLRLVTLRYGDDMARWPPRLVSALQVALVLSFSTLWRKTYRYFDCYPWRLAAAFDPHLARDGRHAVVREF